jgi:hypothetical protein
MSAPIPLRRDFDESLTGKNSVRVKESCWEGGTLQ